MALPLASATAILGRRPSHVASQRERRGDTSTRPRSRRVSRVWCQRFRGSLLANKFASFPQ